MKLTEREIELLDSIIDAQKNYAGRCDAILGCVMAEKQKVWHLERIELLEKIRDEARGSKSTTPA